MGVWSPGLGYKRTRAHARFSAVRTNRVEGVISRLGLLSVVFFEFPYGREGQGHSAAGEEAVRGLGGEEGPGTKGKTPAAASAAAPATADLRALIRDTFRDVLKEQKDGAKAADVTPASPIKYSRLVCMGYGRGLGVNC